MLRLLRHSTRRVPPGTKSFSSNPRSQKLPPTLLDDTENGFGFVRSNPRDPKPRNRGVTEIRASYYTVMGKRSLADILETMGHHVDGLKFGGGSFTLYPEAALREMIDLCYEYNVYVSTGGFMEHLLTHTTSTSLDIIDRYLRKCKDLGFDVVEISTGFLSLPTDDWARLIEKVQEYEMKPKPELGIQFGAGGDTPSSDLESLGQSDPQKAIQQAKKFFGLGVERIMIESEGITENVVKWRTDIISALTAELPMEKIMFEAADPPVFTWYIREFGIDVNLFIDHSQIVQISALRSGIWGTADTFSKIVSYRPDIHVAAGRISSLPSNIPSRNKK